MAASEDIAELSAMVRQFADDQIAPHAGQWDRDKHFPVDVLKAAGELGLGGIWVAEDVGGSGLTRADGVRIFEQLATACPTVAAYISIHNMATSMIDTAGTQEQRERWIPGLASMGQLASYCLTEAGAGSDAAALRTTARAVDDGYMLDGAKQFISGAGTSAVYVVMARTGGSGAKGVSAFVVPADAEGLSFGANEAKMGWNAQPTREVVLDGVHVPADHLLGEEGQGFAIAMRGLDGGRLNIAACSLGGAQAAFDAALAHLRTREAFGGPLIEQQSLQFALADMATKLHASRLMLHDAADALDAGAPGASATCAMTKRFVTDSCFEVANSALQLFGGYGYLWEYGVEKIVRDLRVHQILEGTNEIMQVVLARSLVKGRR
ncbi:isobutyryl-CoA dehydrogenase [Marihabitans asiaticum]|uniref:Alkylation response protein AidB-like acyl-CoA dehydrogenase n=1 Tax=Marihabitans asiaticum TaxID=415218 RepID=A0A560WE85_9MICO|nr:acyl-CoA dehydrogenase family protein [Marihabitans asiaticum]TWD15844.1 alkylation response protein AidB-like acyl-CoA dehydrogenase [Marihabitans asiaticum]